MVRLHQASETWMVPLDWPDLEVGSTVCSLPGGPGRMAYERPWSGGGVGKRFGLGESPTPKGDWRSAGLPDDSGFALFCPGDGAAEHRIGRFPSVCLAGFGWSGWRCRWGLLQFSLRWVHSRVNGHEAGSVFGRVWRRDGVGSAPWWKQSSGDCRCEEREKHEGLRVSGMDGGRYRWPFGMRGTLAGRRGFRG